MTSYVINRKYFVTIDQSASCDVQALFGVSQGSILGPILFNLYFRDTEKLAKSHGLQIYRYADNMQCYFGAERQLSRNLIADKIRCFVHDLKSWMSNNFLKLNENKTNVIEFASIRIDKCNLPPLDQICRQFQSAILRGYINNSLLLLICVTAGAATYVANGGNIRTFVVSVYSLHTGCS